jgi:hypothetical protein
MNVGLKTDNELDSSSDRTQAPLPPISVRWLRLAAITLPLIILNTGWIANSEMKTGVTEVTISSLFMGVTFILFAATLLNQLVRRFVRSSAALNQPELMALYTLVSISSVVAGVGHFGFIIPYLTVPFDPRVAVSDYRNWLYLLPRCIGPRDPSVLLPMFVGHSTFFRRQFMAAWACPLAVWSVFFLVVLWTTLCLSAIIRRRWEEDEHLPFPIIALPMEMTRDGAPLYTNKYMWLGFAIPAVLHSLNSLHSIYPSVPSAAINSLHDYVADGNLQTPWSGMGSFYYLLHPSGVGFGYLISTDVSFSLWFFYLFKKIGDVLSVVVGMRNPTVGFGMDSDGQFPYYSGQGWGAWMFLGLSALWVARKDITAFVRRAVDPVQPSSPHSNEAMSARTAVFGFLGGFLALCAFVWMLGGSWWLPVVFLAAYILIMLVISRLRAETALVCSDLVWVTPSMMLPAILGTGNVSHVDLAHMGMLSWFNSDYRAPGMPHELEGFVAQHRSRGRLSPLVPAIMIAAAVSMVAALLWDLQLYYVNGMATGNINSWRVVMGGLPWYFVQTWIQNPKPPDGNMIGAMGLGAAVTLLLSLLRVRFVGFPLHPAGYVLNMSGANDYFWCDMLVAWSVKSAILRYGGMKTYQSCMPFFLGLILGDFVTGSIWSIIGALFHLNLFRTFAT